MELTMNTTITLNNGIKMPMLGYGTALISENLEETTKTICQAIEAGYRHLDTAMIYYNEEAVGEAIRRCGIPREKLFVTTKLWTEDQRRDRQYEAFEESLSRLGLDYVDLYLIHWPVPGKVLPSWKVMERIYREGRARAIGLSNCHEHYIESILKECVIRPAVNQYEFHPRVTSVPLRAYCAANEIAFEAFYPLGHGSYLENLVLKRIADRHGKTIPQVLLRWDLQHGVIPIPKSAHQERIIENRNIYDFELTPWDMVQIDNLNQNQRIVDADPDNVDF